MKLISFAIPSYNSEAYLHHAVDTILTGGEDVEIIIINDGSKDGTAAIADSYVEKYPTIVKAVHKPNGGHGSGVNRGLVEATGLYYKVVDSDDWVDEKALRELILTVKRHVSKGIEADLYIHNFVYEHVEDNTQKCRSWTSKFPVNRFFGWDEMKPFMASETLLMHNLMYKTEKLRESGTVLPEHTFYVDNIFAFQPLPYCEKLYYMDVNLYHYFIGRDDQSVNEQVMLTRIDQQIRVNKIMIDVFTRQNWSGLDKNVRKYMIIYLNKIMTVTSVILLVGGTSEDYAKKCDLWSYLKSRNEKLYFRLRMTFLGVAMNLPTKLGRRTTVRGYKIVRKFIHFN